MSNIHPSITIGSDRSSGQPSSRRLARALVKYIDERVVDLVALIGPDDEYGELPALCEHLENMMADVTKTAFERVAARYGFLEEAAS